MQLRYSFDRYNKYTRKNVIPMGISMQTPFQNDPFIVLAEAYRRLWDKPYLAVWSQHSADDEDSYGITACAESSVPIIVIFAEHTVNEQIETFAHELAHVAVGVEHGHDAVFELALKKIKHMYDVVYEELVEGMDGQGTETTNNKVQEARRIYGRVDKRGTAVRA